MNFTNFSHLVMTDLMQVCQILKNICNILWLVSFFIFNILKHFQDCSLSALDKLDILSSVISSALKNMAIFL